MSALEQSYSSANSTSKLEKIKSFDNLLSSNYKIEKLSSKRLRFKSDNTLSRFEEKQLLSNISKNQRRMSGCFEDKINSFEREQLIEKCERSLKNFKLADDKKKSIFHQFCYLLGFIFEKLCSTEENLSVRKLNIIAAAILLLSFRLETSIADKKSTFDLIADFLDDAYETFTQENFDEISYYEAEIINVLESSPEIINDNNLYQLSTFLFNLFINKYPTDIDEDEIEDIKTSINFCNEIIEIKYSNVYNLYPIDKALMSFYSSMKFTLNPNKSMINKLDDFYSYLKTNLENSKISKIDFEINCKDIITRLKHKDSDDFTEN